MLAPTGTISFLMDCDTTGIEPDFSLVKFKELVGGGQMTIVNGTVPLALRTLGYDEHAGRADRGPHRRARARSSARPGWRDEHLEVFDVAVGERAISHMGHIKMMGAVQPFISGAISKTVNMPESSTVGDIADVYLQALEARRQGARDLPRRLEDRAGAAHRQEGQEEAGGGAGSAVDVEPIRRRMPRERQSITHKFSIGRATRATSPPACTRTARSARSSSPTSARRARPSAA